MIERDFDAVLPFEIRSPAEQRIPFVFNSPHSGRHYPAQFLSQSRLDANGIRKSEDSFVEELFQGAVGLGAPMLLAHFPRAYLDANREPYELDPRMFVEPLPAHFNSRSARVLGGLGTVPKLVGEGQEIYDGRIALSEALGRIEAIYKPYHETLAALLLMTQKQFGYSVLIDCHSMPTGIRMNDSGIKPDFIIGDRFGTSCNSELARVAIGLLREMGYVVAHNKPYAGGYITEHYGRPAKGLHALQIEVNRGLYMDELLYLKTAGFHALQRDITRFMSDLTSIPDYHFVDTPIAAE